MNDELISANEIYLQDVVCGVVEKHPKGDDIALYNTISTMVEIPSLEVTEKIFKLIRINKTLFNN